MAFITQKWRGVWPMVLLACLTLVTFWPVLGNDFIRYDDSVYVLDNPRVLNGITWSNIVWALSTGHASYWHPLTWLSHMLDVQLFGLNPRWHHFTSLLLHTANSLLLFQLFRRITGREWPSAFVAVIFALHPLHVESVAWVAERKDVLSTFFLLLSLLAYSRYALGRRQEGEDRRQEAGSRREGAGGVQRGDGNQAQDTNAPGVQSSKFKVQSSKFASQSPGLLSSIRHPRSSILHPPSSILNPLRDLSPLRSPAYLWALVFFAFGLMSKPMIVTLPFLLLLLDYWPLQRFKLGVPRSWFKSTFPFILEKTPFLLLTAITCVATVAAQETNHAVLKELPLRLRVANAAVSYLKYLGKTIWPENLSIFYPHPNTRYFVSPAESIYPRSEQWPPWGVAAAILLILAVSVVAIVCRQKRPWLLTGWFWYIGTLLPVIGIIQVGFQAMADRYTYIPLVGIFIIIAWGSIELLSKIAATGVRPSRAQQPRMADEVSKVSEPAIGPNLAAPETGALRWRILAACGVLVISACALATHKQIGYWRNNFTVFHHALGATPRNSVAEFNVGSQLVEQKEFEKGEAHLRQALAADPYNADAYAALGFMFESKGQPDAAMAQFEHTLQLRPWDDLSRCHIAALLESRGQRDEAIAQYEAALRSNPDNVLAHYRVGAALCERGILEAGVQHFEAALRLRPNYPDALLYLSDVRLKQGKLIEAEIPLRELVRLYPTNSELRINLGSVLWQRGMNDLALAQFGEALRLNPTESMAHFNMATVLAADGKFSESATHFAEALRLRPDYSEARVELGRVLSKQRRYAEAQAILEEGLQLAPTNAPLRRQLSTVLLLQGRTNEASAVLTNGFNVGSEKGQ